MATRDANKPGDGQTPVPAAFEDALYGDRGWGLTRADGLVALLTAAAVVALCCVLWFGYGVSGVPGIGGGQEPAPEVDVPVDAGWDPAAPQIEVDGGSMGVSATGAAAQVGLVAVVQNSEGVRVVLPLSQDTQLVVEGELGVNVIEVRDGSVRCLEADCSNQVCVNTGWVGAAGQMIVCLPHELTVQVVRDAADAAPLV